MRRPRSPGECRRRPLAGIDDGRKSNLRYRYDPLVRLINVRGATPESFAHDPAGNYSGEIKWSAKYRPYGNLAALDVSEIGNPLRFQGQYFNAETGLHYNRHRYYNPNSGRFLTPDRDQACGGLNNYQYMPRSV